MIDLPLKLFYKVGIFCFSVMFIASIGNMVLTFDAMNFYNKIYTFGSLIFNFMLVWLFVTMYNNAPPVDNSSDLDSEELEELIGGFENAP